MNLGTLNPNRAKALDLIKETEVVADTVYALGKKAMELGEDPLSDADVRAVTSKVTAACGDFLNELDAPESLSR